MDQALHRSTAPASPPTASVGDAVRLAWTRIQRADYPGAAAALAAFDEADLNVGVPARLARNLTALETHRPRVLSKLVGAGLFKAMQSYPPAPTASGQLVPTKALPKRAAEPVSTNADPRAAADLAIERLEDHIRDGRPIVFADVIDGYLITQLAAAKPTLPVGQQQPIYLAEPDPLLLIACLMLHDWSGPDSPITDPRFVWFVGPRAWANFEGLLKSDRMLVPPQIKLGRETPRLGIGEVLKRCEATILSRNETWSRGIRDHYADFRCDALTVGTQARPKVLLITSRFTTVLQHATADCEQAFARLGWRTQTLIEPSAIHRTTQTSVRHALATFRPDLVFAIDQLRSHFATEIPERLPYVCWVQDQLPRFTCPEAGASVGPRDFVLSMVGPMYTRQWGYPARQIVEMPKLTRPPVRPANWTSDGDEMVYVSSASQRPEQIVESFGDAFWKKCGRSMIDTYARGDALPTMWHVGRVVDRVAKQMGLRLKSEDRAIAVNELFHPLNNALYRQQALRWVAAAADDLGMSFALHGPGWDRHPDFARFARGPVAYGPDLETLTRRSKINLQIVPSFCLHQRLLDGLVAGGFFLVRAHPSDTLMPTLLQQIDPAAKTVGEAFEAAGPNRAQLEQLFAQAECLTDLGMPIDLVEWLRGCQRAELMNTSGVALPRLDEISFHDADSLRQRLNTYRDYAALRRRVAGLQRESVEHRLSYTAGLRRTLSRIGRLIAQEPVHRPTDPSDSTLPELICAA